MSHKRVAAITIGLVAAGCLLAELLLRLTQPEPPGPTIRRAIAQQTAIPHGATVPDSELGALPTPSSRFQVETPDYRYTLRTDHAGFPNLDPWPSQLDVAVLGNSLITGPGVGYEGQFTTQLQRALGDRSVLNFGVSDGGTEHQLRVYRKYVAPLKPRLVIATLWLVYEIDNSISFHRWLSEPQRPDFTTYAGRDASLNASALWRQSVRWATDHSRLLYDVRHVSRRLRGLHEPVEQVVLRGSEVVYLSADQESQLANGLERPGRTDVNRIFFGPLQQLKAEVEANGATLWVVLVPSKEEIYAGQRWPDVLRPVVAARAELAKRGFTTIDLYPQFSESAASQAAFYRADMHLNEFGNRLVADALAKAIQGGALTKGQLPNAVDLAINNSARSH